MKNFAITGIAGYIAPRHLRAIKDTGNNLVAAMDPHDSVGILDSFFPGASFFTEIERFDRHLEKLRRAGDDKKVDYMSVCSPNHLHDAHIRFALRLGADAICEKPLVLNPWNLDALEEIEKETGKRVYTILQLRTHPALLKLREEIKAQKRNSKFDVTLTYITSRGPWYDFSWKGDIQKSGGVATNIGVHFFDLLMWLFGGMLKSDTHLAEKHRAGGFIELDNANVKWFLSIDRSDLPEQVIKNGKITYRSIQIEGNEVEFTEGFTDLHTEVYRQTLAGNGFGISDARKSIEAVYNIRNSKISANLDAVHPFTLKYLSK
jgi:UDP-N-acetyl-2-amino-2-deoxyglucuronate dehydrogenase